MCNFISLILQYYFLYMYKSVVKLYIEKIILYLLKILPVQNRIFAYLLLPT